MGNQPRSLLCQWPDCTRWAKSEIRRGERMRMMGVCGIHREEYEQLPIGLAEKVEWQSRRRAGAPSSKRRRRFWTTAATLVAVGWRVSA